MMAAREIDPEQNWFFQQGYHDGLGGLRAIAPDEARSLCQRSVYYAGYVAGAEDRVAHGEVEALVHCWEDGPRTEDDCSTTCMLPDGHPGEHEWTPDDQITIQFSEGSQ